MNRKTFVIGVTAFACATLIGGLLGAAVAVNHPHQPDWQRAWAVGLLIGAAVGVTLILILWLVREADW